MVDWSSPRSMPLDVHTEAGCEAGDYEDAMSESESLSAHPIQEVCTAAKISPMGHSEGETGALWCHTS